MQSSTLKYFNYFNQTQLMHEINIALENINYSFLKETIDHLFFQLFNLKDDPSESHDLAKSHPEKLQTMMKALVREFKDSNAMLPVERKTEEILNISLPD